MTDTTAPATTTLSYPHDARPIPKFSLDVPAEWHVTEFPGCLLAAGSSDGPDGPWVNLLISHERITLREHQIVFELRRLDLQAKHEDIEVESENWLNLDLKYLVRVSHYTDPDTQQRVSQVDASVVAPFEDVGDINLTDDLYTLTFITPAELFEELGSMCADVVKTFSFI